MKHKSYFLIECKENPKVLPTMARISSDHLKNAEDYENLLFGFSDPSSVTYPGWTLRNFILFLLYYW